MLVIGLGHRMRMGKDTFAKYIKEMYGNKYTIKTYSLAQELKKEVNELYEHLGGWTKLFDYVHNELGAPDWVVMHHDNALDWTDPLCPYGKQRTLLQWWGTEYRRAKSPNYWIKKLAESIKADEETHQIGIVTDIRFPSEFYWVKSFGRDGITVKVERTGCVIHENNEHQSEKALDGYEFDYTITANSLEELRDDAIGFFEMIIARDRIPDEFKEWKA